ncbi:MAG: hypothetical protein NVSMB3_07100 [Acidobacteriaceae bacterium]
MDMRSKERLDDLPAVETPEDVAVLYSWANLHGAKYRDFSASRREYRAQLRHRAAEQAREMELRAQAKAESAATYAERAARQAEEAAMSNQAPETDSTHQRALREAEEAAQVAAAERIEAARRAEAAALAEASARREQREIADANASARRQAAQYADAELRRRQAEKRETAAEQPAEIPGEISDPYTPQLHAQPRPPAAPAVAPPQPQATMLAPVDRSPARYNAEQGTIAEQLPAPAEQTYNQAPPPAAPAATYSAVPHPPAPVPPPQPARRPQGYRPDDASGVRQIYRGPEFEAPRESARSKVFREPAAPQERPQPAAPALPATQPPAQDPRVRADDYAGLNQRTWTTQAPVSPGRDRASAWADGVTSNPRPEPPAVPARQPAPTPMDRSLADPMPRRRRQDSPEYKQEHPSDPKSTPSAASGPARRREDAPSHRAAQPVQAPSTRRPIDDVMPRVLTPEPSGPAWLYASAPQIPPAPPAPAAPQFSVADTLQHSRERVASRWYALKGVFEQPGQEQAEAAPVRQKETRTPILAVFSLAGGVGKTSLVATLGRSLSLLGEKVLLTDTTSHGLLPFYFGASELRQGTVRTFSPPSGSTDAPIYLVSYDVEDRAGDEAAQEALVEEITGSSRGTHRVLLDLTVSSGWIVRRMARLSPTILVPVAPDMNSIISLQAVEKFFNGILDPEGRPLKLFYLLNQFDASLPLHLDVREVLRRQLGDRLLPFVIRRAPAVSEALAEGMTIVDYSPEAPVAEDYLNAATWLRTVAAPATAGFRNVRWSER